MGRLIVALTGASGIIYGVRFIERFKERDDVDTHLVMTDAARITPSQELGMSGQEIRAKVAVVHNVRNVAASISGGSFRTEGMVAIPCSMNKVAAITHCQSNNCWSAPLTLCQ
jgi:flavin prenyltransferase